MRMLLNGGSPLYLAGSVWTIGPNDEPAGGSVGTLQSDSGEAS